MTTFYDFINLIPVNEAVGEQADWTEPLAGAKIAKHLSKQQIRGLVSDEDYRSVVKHSNHIPVFRVKKLPGSAKEVKVGNTGGAHHVHYHITNQGKVFKKTVYRKEAGLHPNMNWAIQSTWKIEDDEKKGKNK